MCFFKLSFGSDSLEVYIVMAFKHSMKVFSFTFIAEYVIIMTVFDKFATYSVKQIKAVT